MKFIQDGDGDWSAHEMPFAFTLFTLNDERMSVIWNYAGSTGETIVDHMQAAIDWCHQFMITTTLDQLQRIR